MGYRRALLVLVLLLAGCADSLARQIVTAPNAGRTLAQMEQVQPLTAQDIYSRQLRVQVGPPEASLMLAVIEPFHLKLDYQADDQGRLTHHEVRGQGPSTRPAGNGIQAARGTIVMLHGYLSSKDRLPYQLWGALLSERGYRVVLVDLRGHGMSTGQYLTYGEVESRDLKQVLDELQKLGLAGESVGVFGISYGAATAIEWAAIDGRVKAVVALESFSDMQSAAMDIARAVIRGWRRFFINDWVLRQVPGKAGQIAGFDPARSSPLRAITSMKTPVLLIHGTADQYLPKEHSERLHQAALDHSELVLVEEDDHITLCYLHLPRLSGKVLAWYEKYVADYRGAGGKSGSMMTAVP
jgi:pimeloyl-ACP methyl ester carboxylesterase